VDGCEPLLRGTAAPDHFPSSAPPSPSVAAAEAELSSLYTRRADVVTGHGSFTSDMLSLVCN